MFYDKVCCSLASIALIFVIITVIFDSFFWAVFLSALYIIGLFWGVQLISFIQSTSTSSSNTKSTNDELCRVCGNNQCKRHSKLPHLNPIPKVPKGFDVALENFLEEILQTYVCAWYSAVSSNEAFVQQLRLAIATTITNISSRLFRADLSSIIFKNLIPIAINHAKNYQELKKKAKELGGNPTDYVADFLESKIHPAAYSREAELNYLRGITAMLLPCLLPATHISTNNQVLLREVLANWVLLPAIDALADPDNLNMLISLCTHHKGKFDQSIDTMYVPMLQTWISKRQSLQNLMNPLKPSLEEVLNDPELLYMFMQHIKDSGLVTLLQFCLDIGDLSKRMLNPEMTLMTEETLYNDAKKIYSIYLDPESIDFLNLPMYISQGMKEILDLGPKKVQEFRTSRPLYDAHQEAHTLLENTWLPSFHHTYQMYKFLCGSQVTNTSVKANSQNSNVSSSIGVGARLTNQLGKIRGVLRASAVDGAPFHPPSVYQAEEANGTPRISGGEANLQMSTSRDLTTWRVTVPNVDGGGPQPLYVVAVHSVSEDKSWTVLRRDQDFYALRAKLSEFHGDKELNDSPLPTRKNPHPSLTANRQRYEDFLQKLLSKPTLRNSELLHAFLTSSNLKPYFTNFSTPDIGVLYQNMAHKLRKEKGQHLDKFMSTFLASTSLKHELPDVGIELSGDNNFHDTQKRGWNRLRSGPFKDNLSLNSKVKNFPYIVNNIEHTTGACFCIAEAMGSLLELSPMICRIIWVITSAIRASIDPFVNKWFYEMIVKLLSGGRAAMVVQLLHSAIFSNEAKHPSSKIPAEVYYNEARSGLHNLVPQWFLCIHSKWCELMDSLLEPIQHAAFNKHLAYMLVDHLLVNLFPELT
ncbi:sorting nexin-14-like [Phymastichus coffea]|uniref:sorting nexin-14-like n=1 Tax=Phymastichus coffea TaxID=108790 RepID=UPI00273CD10A|nr:sorting nexin-14-like [Phymastichus coffea]